jgi:hypothetical protein
VAYPLTIARLNKGRLNAFRLNWIGADVAPPTAPSNLTATAVGGRRVDLAWGAATDNYAVNNYVIERCKGAGCTSWAYAGSTAGSITTFSDTNANPSTTYRYRVHAGDASGNYGPYSNIATATTADLVNIAIKTPGGWVSLNPWARVAGASITQALNEVADTMSLRIDGDCPYALKGAEINWGDADNVAQFAGHITAVRTTYEGRARNRVYECDCIDYTWLLNSKKVTQRYTNAHVSYIINNLVAGFAPGFSFSPAGITNDLILDEITFTNEELAQAISRTCERGGLYWYVTYDKYVFPFNSTAVQSAGTIDQANPRQSSKLAKHEDYVPVATRIWGRGNGASASVDVPAGSTTIPIDDASWYSSGGGWIECGPQRIFYAGVNDPGTGSIVGAGNAPASGPTVGSATGSNLGAGLAYRYAVSFVTANGETLPGPAIVYTPTGGSVAAPAAPSVELDYYSGSKLVIGGSYRWALEFEVVGGGRVGGAASAAISIPAGDGGLPKWVRVYWPSSITSDPNVTKINVCRTTNGGGTFYFDLKQASPGMAGNVKSSELIDADLVQMGQMAGGSGGSLLAARLSQIPTSARPGVTARKLYRTAANGSQLKLLATINDNTTTTYTDTTTDAALGANAPTLDTSGILGGGQINAGASAILVASVSPFSPAGGWVRVGERVLPYSGISGSSLTLPTPLDSTLSYGTEIINAPHLTGIPQAGIGGCILYPIAAGDQAMIFTWVDDQAAINALAAATGGDGIKEEFLTDGRLAWVELSARCQAMLTMRKDPLVTVTFETRDPAVTVGKTITFNTTEPPIVGTFLIQRVTISDFQAKGSIAHPGARRVVEASSRRYTFDDLVQQIKLLGRIN